MDGVEKALEYGGIAVDCARLAPATLPKQPIKRRRGTDDPAVRLASAERDRDAIWTDPDAPHRIDVVATDLEDAGQLGTQRR